MFFIVKYNGKKAMKKKWIAAIAIYAGLFAICVIALYAVPSVRGMLERTYAAEFGTIDVKDEVSAFIVRDETVYVAKQPSLINRLADPGELVRANSRVVELTPDESAIENEANKDYGSKGGTDSEAGPDTYADILEDLGDSTGVTAKGYSKDSGYVSYYVDGAESKLSTASLDGLTYKELKELTGRSARELPKKKCKTGDPVFKITKNSKWYLVFWLSNKDAEKYVPGDTVTIDINGEPVSVTVNRVESGSKKSKIILTCKSFFDGFLEKRTLDTTVTLVSAEGLLLEDGSIVEAPDGRIGVFVKNKLGEHVFKPVCVKADDGTNCVVYSDIYVDADGNFVETLATYDEVIAEPSEEDIASLEADAKAKEEQQAKEKKSEEKKTEDSKAEDKQAEQNADQ